MSIKLVSLVMEEFEGNTSETYLAVCLADIADDDGEHIYPSVAHLARKHRGKRRNVQYMLAKFRSSGFLEPLGDERGGRSKTRHYRISPAWIEAAQQSQLSKKKGRKRCTVVSKLSATGGQFSQRVQTAAGKGANDGIKGCNGMHPDPSISIRIREEAPARAAPTGSRGAPEKTQEELKKHCLRLAAEGFDVDAIVQILRPHALTRDEVATWVTGAPQQS